MTHVYRFYVPHTTFSEGDSIVLSPTEAHHASHVVRLSPGEYVSIFNGEGLEAQANISKISKKEVVVEIQHVIHHASSPFRVILAQAWLHQNKAIEEIIQRGTELGISHFIFFRAERSQSSPRMNDKWQRIAIETCKQCCRMWLPTFQTFGSLPQILDYVPSPILVAYQSGESINSLSMMVNSNKDITLIIGPEGDFTPTEIDLLSKKNARFFSLGRTIFRSEVAAILFSSLVLKELGAFQC